MATDALSLAFAALADPTRRMLLARLAQGATSVNELAAPFDMSTPAVSKHLKVLERAGLVETGRLAQARPRRLVAQPLQAAAQWLEVYRPLWEARLDRLDGYVRELKAAREQGGNGPPGAKRPGRAGAPPRSPNPPRKKRS
ncbi:ArsR/SmtB family transcription factor [Ramlibacter tataouinensis]|uniref:Transcriptional regulator, ArsR family-like protein n=1 Tax=Ramlibacter tataouinensis (strain ATCC BAA-407 / DSM 14655 / LMG 21543 / TTB310) TaxID=365046 RepID=F5XXL7_RAMTT|nr:metalloregulator ArsR/SmtB family transcription factor [Ramlibacter tataouinensis]AEG91820.1 transcriptional regulator, ArsR family-like protein [Ramlibacter tataouinensis TTB310]